MTNTRIFIAALAIAVVAGVVCGLVVNSTHGLKKLPTGSDLFGAAGNLLAENYDPYIQYNGGFNTQKPVVFGLNGTSINRLNTGKCFIAPYAATIAATSTATVDCQATAATASTTNEVISALTGVVFNDTVVATLSTTTSGTSYMGLRIIGVSASTTAGYIVLVLANITGGTFTWPVGSGTASGTASYFVSN